MTVNTKTNEFSIEKSEKSSKSRADLNKFRGLALGWILPIVLLVVWEATARFGLIDSYVFPAPTTIFQKILEMAEEGTLWGHIGITFFRVFIGFFAGTFAALVLGSIVGYFKWFEQLMDPLIQAFQINPFSCLGAIIHFVDGNWRIVQSGVNCCWCFLSGVFEYRIRYSRC